MWGAPTWRAGYDGIQHPGLCLRFDERLPKTGNLSIRIKETKDLAKGLTGIKYCTVRVGDVEHRADTVMGAGEIKWNSKLDFTLHGDEDFVNVAVGDAGQVECTSIIPIIELLAAVHPTMPLAPTPDDHKDKVLPLQADCKALHAALQHTTALPDHLKEAITELIAGAYVDPPRHDAWFSLYDAKFTLVGLVNLCFYFTPSHYPKAPKASTLNDLKAKPKPTTKSSWFGRKAATDLTPSAPKPDKYYGVSIEEATAQSGGALPVPLSVLCDYLAREGLITEGIFRVAGSKGNIDAIVDAFKHDTLPTLTDVHDAAGALKAFFRQMPEPVIPFSHYDGFIGIAGDTDRSVEEKKALYQSMVQNLPPQNIAVVKHLLAFLNKVAAHSEVNLMTADNLAIVFAPNLLRPEEDDAKLMVADAGPAHQAVAMIIKYAQEILPPDQVVLESSSDFLGLPGDKHAVLTVRRSSLDRRASVSTNPVNGLAKALSDLETLKAEVGAARGRQAASEAERQALRDEIVAVKAQWLEELAQARAELEQSRKESAEVLARAEEEHSVAFKQKEAQYQQLLGDNTSLMTEMSTQARETAALVFRLKTQREEETAQAQAQAERIRKEAEEDLQNMTRDYTKASEQQKAELSRVQMRYQEDSAKLQQRMAELTAELETLKTDSAAERKRNRAEAEKAQEQLSQFTMKSVDEKNAIMEQLLAQQQLRLQAQLESSTAITTQREQVLESHSSPTRLAPDTCRAITEAVSSYIEEQAEVILRSGTLSKHSSGFPKRWQTRQCTLTSRKLSWLSPHKHAKTVLGCIHLDDIRSAAPVNGVSQFVVYVHNREGTDRAFEFAAQDVATRDAWVVNINAALAKVQRSKGTKPESLDDMLQRVTDELDPVVLHTIPAESKRSEHRDAENS